MAHPATRDLSTLCEIPILCAAIAASPTMRTLFVSSQSSHAEACRIVADAPCGDVIAAIYDLLADTPLAPHAAEIVDAVLTRSVAIARHGASTH